MGPAFLGLKAVYHESSAAVVMGGRVVSAVEEERLSRVKHAKKAEIDQAPILPFLAIDAALASAGLGMGDIGAIGYSFDPEARLASNVGLPDEPQIVPGDYGTRSGEERFHRLVRQVPALLAARFGSALHAPVRFLDHHACHAASAYYAAPLDEAAVLSIDGIGEIASTTLWHGRGPQMRRLAEVRYPHSLGFLWEKITSFLGFTQNHDECKIMGLAWYGDPARYREAFSRFARLRDDGGFDSDNALLGFRSRAWGPIEGILGPRRLPHEPLGWKTGGDMRHADIAAALQDFTERAFLALAARARRETGSRRLCLAGGVALNCVANARLALEADLEHLWIQPGANDAGTAIGAALLLHHESGGTPKIEAMPSPYLGPEYPDAEIERALKSARLPYSRVDDPSEVAAGLVEANDVVAWFQGRMEFGPRALGNRSILADPRDPGMVEELNVKVKHREVFRPFCPSVLAERAPEWFETAPGRADADRFMLLAYRVRSGFRGRIPAVTHVDGTSRIQSVIAEENPRFRRLIEAFDRRTGVPMLLNTSFNDSEPIVCTPDDAVRTFLKTKIDHLVIGDFLVHKSPSHTRVRS
ncbi:MAG: carbamoyl transferase [Planctomycetes bacterium]|nr:carbamoyl transferase [Planctomycetota bacterium]